MPLNPLQYVKENIVSLPVNYYVLLWIFPLFPVQSHNQGTDRDGGGVRAGPAVRGGELLHPYGQAHHSSLRQGPQGAHLQQLQVHRRFPPEVSNRRVKGSWEKLV